MDHFAQQPGAGSRQRARWLAISPDIVEESGEGPASRLRASAKTWCPASEASSTAAMTMRALINEASQLKASCAGGRPWQAAHAAPSRGHVHGSRMFSRKQPLKPR